MRLRWLGPFGLEVELSETLETGRGGMLTASHEARRAGAAVWVTFPYDAGLSQAVPEVAARVAHSRTTEEGRNLVGLAFAPRITFTREGARGADDRRGEDRVPLALPITIEREDSPWPDETMTVDMSPRGVLYCTLRVYEAGEVIEVMVQSGRWVTGGRRKAKVARVEDGPGDSPLQYVAAEFLP
ncbi:MAG: PilZ domain-containing protein [Bryobacteraceae bacterium]